MNTQPIREYDQLVEDFVAAFCPGAPERAHEALTLMLRIAHERGWNAGARDTNAQWRKAIGDVQ